jgi:hypothetical protein
MVSKTTMRATVYTMLSTIGFSFGHWLLFMMCCMPIMVFTQLNRGGGNMDLERYLAFFLIGITPPIALGVFAYNQEDLSERMAGHHFFAEMLGFCLLGVFLYTMASLMLWFVLIVPRFRSLTRRDQSSSEAE